MLTHTVKTSVIYQHHLKVYDRNCLLNMYIILPPALIVYHTS